MQSCVDFLRLSDSQEKVSVLHTAENVMLLNASTGETSNAADKTDVSLGRRSSAAQKDVETMQSENREGLAGNSNGSVTTVMEPSPVPEEDVESGKPEKVVRARRSSKAMAKQVDDEEAWSGAKEVRTHENILSFLRDCNRWQLMENRGSSHVSIVNFLKKLNGLGSDLIKEYRNMFLDLNLSSEELESENRAVVEVIFLLFSNEMPEKGIKFMRNATKLQLIGAIVEHSHWPTADRILYRRRSRQLLDKSAHGGHGSENGNEPFSPSTNPKASSRTKDKAGSVAEEDESPKVEVLRKSKSTSVGRSAETHKGEGLEEGTEESRGQEGEGEDEKEEKREEGEREQQGTKEELLLFLSDPESWPRLKYRSKHHYGFKSLLREMRETDPGSLQVFRKVLEEKTDSEPLKTCSLQVLQVLACALSSRTNVTHTSRDKLLDFCVQEGPWAAMDAPPLKLRSVNASPLVQPLPATSAPESLSCTKRKRTTKHQSRSRRSTAQGEAGEAGEEGEDSWKELGGHSGSERRGRGGGDGKRLSAASEEEPTDVVEKIRKFLSDCEQWGSLSGRGKRYLEMVGALRELQEADVETLQFLKAVLMSNPNVDEGKVCSAGNPTLRILAHVLTEDINVERASREKLVKTCLLEGGWVSPIHRAQIAPRKPKPQPKQQKKAGKKRKNRRKPAPESDSVRETSAESSEEEDEGTEGGGEEDMEFPDIEASTGTEVGSGGDCEPQQGTEEKSSAMKEVKEWEEEKGKKKVECEKGSNVILQAEGASGNHVPNVEESAESLKDDSSDELDALREVRKFGDNAILRLKEGLDENQMDEVCLKAKEALDRLKKEEAVLREEETAVKLQLQETRKRKAAVEGQLAKALAENKMARFATGRRKILERVSQCEAALEEHFRINRELQNMPTSLEGKWFTRRELKLRGVWESLQRYKDLREELRILAGTT